MTERPAPDGDRPAEPFALLRVELSTLLRELPGGYRRLVARLGDCEVDVTWPDPPRDGGSGECAGATGPAGRVGDRTDARLPAPDGGRAAGPGDDRAEGTHVVRAPMVGTVYRAPEPGGRPFVQVGDRVVAGQVVAVIEAMKLMNRVESPWSGTLTEILVEDADVVEFDQVLARITPAEAGG